MLNKIRLVDKSVLLTDQNGRLILDLRTLVISKKLKLFKSQKNAIKVCVNSK